MATHHHRVKHVHRVKAKKVKHVRKVHRVKVHRHKKK